MMHSLFMADTCTEHWSDTLTTESDLPIWQMLGIYNYGYSAIILSIVEACDTCTRANNMYTVKTFGLLQPIFGYPSCIEQ